MSCLWKVSPRDLAAATWAGEVPGDEPQLQLRQCRFENEDEDENMRGAHNTQMTRRLVLPRLETVVALRTGLEDSEDILTQLKERERDLEMQGSLAPQTVL